MAGVLTGLHQFGPDTGPESLNLLDGNYGLISAAINYLGTYGNSYVDSGVADALVVTIDPAQTAALINGLPLYVKVAATNLTNTPTLNLAVLGARTIGDAQGFALLPGQLAAGMWITLIFDLAGNKWRCQNYNNFGTGVSPELRVSKAANTTRNTLTIPANDPDLVLAIPFAGRWAFQLTINAFATTSAAMGMNGNINFSAGFTAASSFVSSQIQSNGPTWGSAPGAVQIVGTQTPLFGPFQVTAAMSTNANIPASLTAFGVLVATAPGNLGFSWSQFASSGANLNMLAGSFFTAKPM